MRKLVARKLADAVADAVSRSHAEAIVELQSLPASTTRVFKDVVLPSGVEVPVPHRLGRQPIMVKVSPVRSPAAITAGVIVEYRGASPSNGTPIDVGQFVVLAAFGYGATVTVDVEVS